MGQRDEDFTVRLEPKWPREPIQTLTLTTIHTLTIDCDHIYHWGCDVGSDYDPDLVSTVCALDIDFELGSRLTIWSLAEGGVFPNSFP